LTNSTDGLGVYVNYTQETVDSIHKMDDAVKSSSVIPLSSVSTSTQTSTDIAIPEKWYHSSSSTSLIAWLHSHLHHGARIDAPCLLEMDALDRASMAYGDVFSIQREVARMERRSASVSDDTYSFLNKTSPSACLPDNTAFFSGIGSVVGGTFDHLHEGHSALLALTALSTAADVTVGVSADALLVNKLHADLIESWEHRCRAIAAAVSLHRGVVSLQTQGTSTSTSTSSRLPSSSLPSSPLCLVDCHSLSDPYGPSASKAGLDTLVLSAEVASAAPKVIDERKRQGNGSLRVLELPLVHHPASLPSPAPVKASSTAIRALIAEHSLLATPALAHALQLLQREASFVHTHKRLALSSSSISPLLSLANTLSPRLRLRLHLRLLRLTRDYRAAAHGRVALYEDPASLSDAHDLAAVLGDLAAPRADVNAADPAMQAALALVYSYNSLLCKRNSNNHAASSASFGSAAAAMRSHTRMASVDYTIPAMATTSVPPPHRSYCRHCLLVRAAAEACSSWAETQVEGGEIDRATVRTLLGVEGGDDVAVEDEGECLFQGDVVGAVMREVERLRDARK
jgi:phosphopantetheine adenylyltransferase